MLKRRHFDLAFFQKFWFLIRFATPDITIRFLLIISSWALMHAILLTKKMPESSPSVSFTSCQICYTQCSINVDTAVSKSYLPFSLHLICLSIFILKVYQPNSQQTNLHWDSFFGGGCVKMVISIFLNIKKNFFIHKMEHNWRESSWVSKSEQNYAIQVHVKHCPTWTTQCNESFKKKHLDVKVCDKITKQDGLWKKFVIILDNNNNHFLRTLCTDEIDYLGPSNYLSWALQISNGILTTLKMLLVTSIFFSKLEKFDWKFESNLHPFHQNNLVSD